MPSSDNLIWIDLEMTGLKPETDSIIEIATVVTDKELVVIADGEAKGRGVLDPARAHVAGEDDDGVLEIDVAALVQTAFDGFRQLDAAG